MKDYFLEKYKTKSKYDLQKIIDNKDQYQPEAIIAATHLLNHWKDAPVSPDKGVILNSHKETESKTKSFSPIFDYKPFVRSLSYREFLTSITLALFCQAFIDTINYYSDEHIFEEYHNNIKFTFLILIFLANHIYYRYEHGRSNNFIGRSLNDLVLLFSIILTRTLYLYIVTGSLEIIFNANGMGAFSVILGLVILICIFELLVALLNLILKQFKCQIF